MTSIALLIEDTVIYWNQILVVLGILAGFLLVWALRSFTKISWKAVLLWSVLAFPLSFLFSRLFYYYCFAEQFHSFGEALSGFFDHRYSVVGVIPGTLLAALAVKLLRLVKHYGDLLDITFLGAVLTIAIIRLSYLFTDTFHSTIAINSKLWQRPPFAVRVTDAAGNTSYVFAPFLISFIILLLTVLAVTFYFRSRIRLRGDLFRLTFTFFALAEMVLESTRYDSPKLHFLFLNKLNNYVSFISFSMLLCGICLIIMFLLYCLKSLKAADRKNRFIPLAVFAFGIICFIICEYLVQRYTSQATLFHWLQTFFVLIVAADITAVIILHNKNSTFTAEPEPMP